MKHWRWYLAAAVALAVYFWWTRKNVVSGVVVAGDPTVSYLMTDEEAEQDSLEAAGWLAAHTDAPDTHAGPFLPGYSYPGQAPWIIN